MNRPIFPIFLALLCLLNVTSHSLQNKTLNKESNDSTLSTEIISSKLNYHSICGIDSVVKADYVFADFLIDSITVRRHVFNAVYLYCFKGMIQPQNYRFFKNRQPDEYQRINDIHTAHLLNFGSNDFSFNGFGSIGCFSVPESTMVSVKSKVYSLFSGNKFMGRVIFLESITTLP